MSPDIKNERVHALAREAARRTGRSQTSVIEQALEQLLADLDAPADQAARSARVDAILADIHTRVTDEDRVAMQQFMDDMYDADTGLPV